MSLNVHLLCRYYANTETYLKAVALKRMPPNLQTVDMLKAGKVSFIFSIVSLHTLYLYSFSLGCLMPEYCYWHAPADGGLCS